MSLLAETETAILMAETKARADMAAPEVQAKAEAAVKWCGHAPRHAAEVGAKSWRYLLILHDEVTEAKRLQDYLRFERTAC